MALKYKHTLLLVDDETAITKALQRLFRKEGYDILTANNGQEGLEILKNVTKPVSLIISDQRMPEMSGAEFLEKAKNIFPNAIRFLLTGYSDLNAVTAAVNKGEIHRYLTKPWNNEDLLLQVRIGLEQFELVYENTRLQKLTRKQNDELNTLNQSLEKKVADRTKAIRRQHETIKSAHVTLKESFKGTIRLLSSLVTTLSPILGQYMQNTAHLARIIGEELKLPQKNLDDLEMAGMIHDIGLMGISEETMIESDKSLDSRHSQIFRQHPVIAQTCLAAVEALSDVGNVILHHHEYFDGGGFPDGLKGNSIPIESRILCVAADYCEIVYTWHQEKSHIIRRTRNVLGLEVDSATRELAPEQLLKEIAQKSIILGAHRKYDIDVVTAMVKVIESDQCVLDDDNTPCETATAVSFENLSIDMSLVADLRLTDGRLLLVKGTQLNQKTIQTIRKLGAQKLLDEFVFVNRSSTA
jgi:response regulator RpfG family c-di-GMP phosphodiesterase